MSHSSDRGLVLARRQSQIPWSLSRGKGPSALHAHRPHRSAVVGTRCSVPSPRVPRFQNPHVSSAGPHLGSTSSSPSPSHFASVSRLSRGLYVLSPRVCKACRTGRSRGNGWKEAAAAAVGAEPARRGAPSSPGSSRPSRFYTLKRPADTRSQPLPSGSRGPWS